MVCDVDRSVECSLTRERRGNGDVAKAMGSDLTSKNGDGHRGLV
jgi:hypothetical protein